MNVIEIEEAITELAGQDFDPVGSPFAFLAAFGNKKTTIDKLKKEDILMTREAYFSKTIVELYNLGKMPDDLRHAHDRNDGVVERNQYWALLQERY